MANEPTPTFTADQSTTISRVSSGLNVLALLLVLAGVLRLALGVVEIWKTSWTGFWILPEGLLLAFAGLAFLAGATDAKFLHDVKGREKEHLTHTIESVNVGVTALLILGCYVAFVAFFKMWV